MNLALMEIQVEIKDVGRVYQAIKALGNCQNRLIIKNIYKKLVEAMSQLAEAEKAYISTKDIITGHYALRTKDGDMVINNDGTAMINDMTGYSKEINNLQKDQASIILKLPKLGSIDLGDFNIDIEHFVTFFNLGLID